MMCCTDGRYLSSSMLTPANKHDITIVKERVEDFCEWFRGCVLLLDKGYVDEGFAEVMRASGCGMWL